ncbi:MAG TPA: GTPase Era [Bacteroidales bacterium]|nr:GTPase Era [Bacteroidales bacterium]HPM91998.1 GTPase Era [Bacteroidales bacterium]
MTKHQAGFVNIIGKPNVGKSTLMNALTGENISIITPKAQTTRQRILGIVNEENYQIVFSDTPGILQPQYRLQQAMMREVESAFEDADIILYLVEAGEMPEQNDIAERIIKTERPVILIINKIDLTDQAALENKINRWQEIFPTADIIPVSALLKANLQSVFRSILEKLPENPPYYDKDELTDKTVRYFVAEKIREKILLNYQKEIPYSVEVAVDQFKESDNLIHIIAYIFIARESQKAILLGHQGSAIKRVGTQARRDLEEWLGKKIFLELSVKVLKDWRDSEKELRKFGYDL